jgi:predicted outer membrane lipoprotein
LPRLTWGVVWFSLLAAAFSVIGALLPLLDHRAMRGGWAAGILVGAAGFQITNARRLFLQSHPDEVRRWMQPAAMALYGVALLFFAAAAWTAAHR